MALYEHSNVPNALALNLMMSSSDERHDDQAGQLHHRMAWTSLPTTAAYHKCQSWAADQSDVVS